VTASDTVEGDWHLSQWSVSVACLLSGRWGDAGDLTIATGRCWCAMGAQVSASTRSTRGGRDVERDRF
jgi:hypothetical protein